MPWESVRPSGSCGQAVGWGVVQLMGHPVTSALDHRRGTLFPEKGSVGCISTSISI